MNDIILDTDPGIDDAVAITVLLKNCKEKVKLILASYGNISVDNAAKNAAAMLNLLDINDIPVLKGSRKPAIGSWEEAKHIHGADGLGGINLGENVCCDNIIEGDFLRLTYEKILECKRVDYITLGPLTNLAELIRRYPDVVKHIENVVTMGGGIGKGNVRPYAEFNIFCDPPSADFVFANVKKLTLVPLNTTLTVSFSLKQINSIGDNSELAAAMKKILTANYKNCVKYGEPGSTMHDSTAVLYHLYPKLFETKICGIEVDLGERFGETKITAKRQNVTLTTDCQSELLLKKILECI